MRALPNLAAGMVLRGREAESSSRIACLQAINIAPLAENTGRMRPAADQRSPQP